MNLILCIKAKPLYGLIQYTAYLMKIHKIISKYFKKSSNLDFLSRDLVFDLDLLSLDRLSLDRDFLPPRERDLDLLPRDRDRLSRDLDRARLRSRDLDFDLDRDLNLCNID